MATLQDILSGNFPAAQRYAEGYAQMPSYLQDPYLGLSTSQVGNVTKGLLSKTQFEKAQEIASKNAETLLGLPKGNTAMDRAKAMGYDTPAYHGTNKDISSFIASDIGTYGPGVYTAKNPEIAEGYYQDFVNANTLPLLLKKGKEKQFQSFGDYVNQKGTGRTTFSYGDDLRNEGYNSLNVKFYPEGDIREYNNFNPQDVRSRFAAFDPARANENDLLAGVMAIPVSGLLEQPKDKKKKK
jgi:hypothetical protein